MSYRKNEWKDQKVERPKTYRTTKNDDGSITLIESFGLVEEIGTAVNATNLNRIEEGIANCDLRKYNLNETYEQGEWVTAVVNNKKRIFESLVDDNLGNPITDSTKWMEVSLGGTGGFDVCDIGISLYVDETKGLRRYLNGQIVAINANTQGFLDRLLKIKALHPSLFTSEENWQAEKALSDFGQVGKFVLNYASDGATIESVRIPAIVNVQGLFDLQNLGMTVKAGLPSHKHTRGTQNITATTRFSDSHTGGEFSGAFYNTRQGNYKDGGGVASSSCAALGFDASRSWTGETSAPNYSTPVSTTNTVQPEAIQYPYFIQIATGQETEVDIVNTIELNNPYFLGRSEYFENEPNNLSWLKSAGQWNSKGVYTDYYNWILENVNSGKEGFKLSTAADITDFDFVINTTDETFRLPLLNGSESLISSERIGYPLPTVQSQTYIATCNGIVQVRAVGTSDTAVNIRIFNNTTHESDTKEIIKTRQIQYVNVAVTRGDEFTVLDHYELATEINILKAQGNGSLYYYVGETVQNANLIDIGRFQEQLALKADKSMLGGEWVFAGPQIFTSTAVGTYLVDLSKTLPAEGDSYELILDVSLISTDSKARVLIGVDKQGYFVANVMPIANAHFRSQIFAPLKGKVLKIEIANGAVTTSCVITLMAYRRLGTNV